MGLIGVVLASIVGIFWQNDALQFVISFVRRHRLHRADRLRRPAAEAHGARAADGQIGSYAIVGALTLYLDFINLFLMLLRLFGGRRD